MRSRSSGNSSKFFAAIVAILLSLPIVFYAFAQNSRPPRTNETRSLFQGVTYQRQAWSSPRPVMLHLVTINLTAPGIKPFVTPASKTANPTFETNARTVSEFTDEFEVQIAINANFFYPFREETPLDFHPQSGDLVNSLGQSTSEGDTYSPAQSTWSALCFYAQNRVQIVENGICPPGVLQAVAGNGLLIKQGQPVPPPTNAGDTKAYARTVVAIDKTGRKLWLIQVDGKQFQYSEGLKLSEINDFLLKLGADSALNLDGGGSVTLVAQTPQGAQVLNAPIHTKIPMRERPVANHLGFFAKPL